MSAAAVNWAQQQRVGCVGAKAVLLYLADKADEEHSCFPGQATIAEVTEQSERTVRTQLKTLEQGGYIRRQARFRQEGRGRTSDRYFLLLDRAHVQPADVAGKSVTNRQPDVRLTGNPLPRNNHQRTTSKTLAPDKPARDELFESLAAVERCDTAAMTRTERGKLNAACKQLREVDATPDDVRHRAAEFTRRFPGATVTAPALVKHWTALGPPPDKRQHRCECGAAINVSERRCGLCSSSTASGQR